MGDERDAVIDIALEKDRQTKGSIDDQPNDFNYFVPNSSSQPVTGPTAPVRLSFGG
jgi:hypothetical protein